MLDGELEDWIGDLRQSISHVGLVYEVWWVLAGADTDQALIKNLHKYTWFNTTFQRAYFVTLIVDLYKLYETRANRLSIPELIRRLKSEGLITDQLHSELNDTYTNEAKPIWIKVGILRNYLYAHASNEKTISEAFAAASIKSLEMRQLIGIAQTLLNRISKTTVNSQHAFNLGAKEKTLELLRDIDAGQRALKAERHHSDGN